MSQALRHISVWCCGVGLFVVFASPTAAGLGKPAAAEWLPPTPTEGKRFRVGVGEQLRVALVATTRESPESTVAIEASGVPAGATFRATAGNPAGATVTWIPTKVQAGRRFANVYYAFWPQNPWAHRHPCRVLV